MVLVENSGVDFFVDRFVECSFASVVSEQLTLVFASVLMQMISRVGKVLLLPML